MQTLEFTENERTIMIAIDRTALNGQTLSEITSYLQGLMVSTHDLQWSAHELRRVPPEQRDALLAQQAATDADYEIVEDGYDITEEL
jgi:hypothetical protein